MSNDRQNSDNVGERLPSEKKGGEDNETTLNQTVEEADKQPRSDEKADKTDQHEERKSVSADARVGDKSQEKTNEEEQKAKSDKKQSEEKQKSEEKKPEVVLIETQDLKEVERTTARPLSLSLQKAINGSSQANKSMSKGSKSSRYMKCAICMQSFSEDTRDKQTLACTHVFHQECVQKKGKDVSCPLCSGTQNKIATPCDKLLK